MSMRRVFCALLLTLLASPAAAGVLVRVDNWRQTMQVVVDGRTAFVWPVSTARPGYRTPAGHYRVQRFEPMWYSHKYHMSPMPYALFFRGGYAIHGTGALGQLGRPASHGCVRLSTWNARTLFGMARHYGGAQIVVLN